MEQLTHLPLKLLDCLAHILLGELKLGRHLLGLIDQSHGAYGIGVEGALKVDKLGRFGTDGRRFVGNWVTCSTVMCCWRGGGGGGEGV